MGKFKELYIDYINKYENLLDGIIQDATGIKGLHGVELVNECERRNITIVAYDEGTLIDGNLIVVIYSNDFGKKIYKICRELIKENDYKLNVRCALNIYVERV